MSEPVEVVVMPELDDDGITGTPPGDARSSLASCARGIPSASLLADCRQGIVALCPPETIWSLRLTGEHGVFVCGVRSGRLELNTDLPPEELARQFVRCIDSIMNFRRDREADTRTMFEAVDGPSVVAAAQPVFAERLSGPAMPLLGTPSSGQLCPGSRLPIAVAATLGRARPPITVYGPNYYDEPAKPDLKPGDVVVLDDRYPPGLERLLPPGKQYTVARGWYDSPRDRQLVTVEGGDDTIFSRDSFEYADTTGQGFLVLAGPPTLTTPTLRPGQELIVTHLEDE